MSDDGHHHVLPRNTLLAVFGALLGLTALTVAVSYVSMGVLDVPIAIGIATAKATLVVLFFMALWYDNPVNALTFTIGTIMVVVFITFTLFDTAFRGDLGNVSQRTIEDIQREEEQSQDILPADELQVAPADDPQTQDAGGSADAGDGGR